MKKQEKLVLSIKPKKEGALRTTEYEFKLNDWVLGRGVTKTTLEMSASEMPKFTIEAHLDEVEIIGMDVETFIKEYHQPSE